ncbi:aspartate aminotransferase family protein [Pikeienuella piscinae]|uniref:Acetylornithine aminotransferase n=1 Tax=Pikeienuella piscinae TaxID=2748098 RepID=A0A7L5BSJ8_9RHOB|nr:aspartate aminotransferase family protein [Pikeienuella piscinae]QIE54045.1 aspartate aminotransferase family protein [Pikeienuella piscinae]
MIPTVMPTYARTAHDFVRGEGAWLIDGSGRRHLDFGAGIAVNCLGHAHPKLVAALTEQAGKLWHTSNLYRAPWQEALSARLCELTFADTMFFTNSGAEAMECAFKTARKHQHHIGQTERVEIVVFEGNFHGRTFSGISASGTEKMAKGFGPLLPGFKRVPIDLDAVRAAVGEKTAAICIEPVLGEGGIIPIERDFLRALREIADENGALLIFDEIQCGVGRTGRLFAHEWAGVTPDIMAIAKGIGGGFPIGACLATEKAAAGMVAGSHGSTYGGNPLGCAVALAVLEEITAPGFLDHVNRMAGKLRQKLGALVDAHPKVFAATRGEGLMLGLKCVAPNTDVVQAGYDAGILTVPAADNIVRVMPPLNVTEDEIDEALSRLDQAASALDAA